MATRSMNRIWETLSGRLLPWLGIIAAFSAVWYQHQDTKGRLQIL